MSLLLSDGRNGLSMLSLSHPSGSTAEIYLQGAHLTSWVPAGGSEALFLSRATEIAPGTAIRGGVPVVFPQFAQLGPLPKHGFARLLAWRWLDPREGAEQEGATEATLELVDSDETRRVWPHAFRARTTVRLGERTLTQRLSIENTGEAALSFTAALHTYFRLGDLRQAAVQGLAGVPYEDRTARGEDAVDGEDELVVSGEIDRVYLDAPSALHVHDRANRRVLGLRLDGFEDVVVWNPAEHGAAALPDMEADEYLRMICVEAAQIGRPVELGPGDRWEGGQLLEVADG
jgi:glucose-6-phosphate 1-epimerase